MRIECIKSEDWKPTDEALKSIARTDHSIKVTENSGDGSWTLHAMGAVQFDYILSKLKREFNCEVKAGEPCVEAKEVLAKDLEAVENLCQIGNSKVVISLSAACGNGIDFSYGLAQEIKEALSSALSEFCEAGVCGKGSLANVKFILHKLEISGEINLAVVKKACLDAAKMLVKPDFVEIREPWVNLIVQCPASFAGTVANDLLSRGAKILNSDGDGKKHRFSADAPLSKLARYTTELLSITRGGGNFYITLKQELL
jgi:elongation factor G